MPGAAQCIANVMLTRQRLDAASKKVVKQWSNEVLRNSQKICPRDKGNLMRSGRVTVTKDTATEFYCRIGYTAVYALKQHEMPYHHDVGQWKYLSTPFNGLGPLLRKSLEDAWSFAL
jgi:hypothetical protein